LAEDVAGVGGSVAELELLGCGEADAQAGLRAGDVEGGDVDGLPLFAGGQREELGVVDGVGLVEAEADGGEAEAAVGGRPVGTAFEAPAGFGLEVGIADGGGVGVVEVDVGGLAEAVAGGGAQAEGFGEGEGGGGAGREDRALAGEDFLARADGEREAAERAQAEVGVAGALVARVLAERVGVDGVAGLFEAVGDGGVAAESSARRRAAS
jgi:hypothetical protein